MGNSVVQLPMKRNLRMRGIKITPRNLEKDLIDKARKLAEDPIILLPKCLSKCKRCPFEKLLARMRRISELGEDTDRILSFANWGDQLTRSYAAMISLKGARKIPYLAFVDLPVGKISYAVRGKVDKEKLIGVQYFDVPELRVLAFWDIAIKENLNLYSSESGFFCSGEVPKAPSEYVSDVLNSSVYELDQHGCCSHSIDAKSKLNIQWKSANLSITVCASCLTDGNLLHHLMSGIVAREPLSDFEVRIDHQFQCMSSCAECSIKEVSAIDARMVQKYKEGEVGDAGLLKSYRENLNKRFSGRASCTLIIGERCFGSNIKAFLSNLRGSDAEKEALEGFLTKEKVSIVSSSDQAGKIIGDLWDHHARSLLEQVASATIVDSLFGKETELTPSQLINEAKRLETMNKIYSLLPTYETLGEVGRLADRLARILKTQDKESMLKIIEKERFTDHRTRAVTYAFLVISGISDKKSWQYTEEERSFGLYLSSFAEDLIKYYGEEYHEALLRFIAATGSIEKVARVVKPIR